MIHEPLVSSPRLPSSTVRNGIACWAIAWGLVSGAGAAETPLAVAGRPGTTVGATTVLRDPVDGTAIATLEDPSSQLPSDIRPLVLQTTGVDAGPGTAPALRVVDVLPEFWAEPAVLNHFLKGPGAASGFGNEIRPRDWAGIPATDRRAYPMDAGLRSVELAPSFTIPSNIGRVRVSYLPRQIVLTFDGLGAHAYAVHYTTALTRPFTVVTSLISADSRPQTVVLPASDEAAFFRVVELIP